MLERPKPLCFVAMPFGKKAAPGTGGEKINFDKVFAAIEAGVTAAGMDVLRADLDKRGGFIHKAMYEALLLAEYVVADLTTANANVTYEIGVRHGASRHNTLLICAEGAMGQTPFDFRPLRIAPYRLNKDWKLTPKKAKALTASVEAGLRDLRSSERQSDNPILQITSVSDPIAHNKTDYFVQRLDYVREKGDAIRIALGESEVDLAITLLDTIADEVCEKEAHDVPQLRSVYMALYLAYREKKAYLRMLDLYEKLPRDLRFEAVVLEQRALAQNRLAEQADKGGDQAESQRLRDEALHSLSLIWAEEVTSETYGIKGRIYKGQYDAALARGDHDAAQGALASAIETYELGTASDQRDYYPGVNAVTLRAIRGWAEDEHALRTLIPVVRYAVEHAPAAKDEMERFWQTATLLELACIERDWGAADFRYQSVLAIPVEGWLRETTAANLAKIRTAREREDASRDTLTRFIDGLS